MDSYNVIPMLTSLFIPGLPMDVSDAPTVIKDIETRGAQIVDYINSGLNYFEIADIIGYTKDNRQRDLFLYYMGTLQTL